MLAMLLAAAAPQTAVDAERAFAADAQALGQWTAFRKWAAADATMFLPQPANAQAAMTDWRDPPKAIDWWPTASYVSCDGNMAVNTGGWRQPNGSVGYFSTVWRRQADGNWRWLVDGGDALPVARPRPARIDVVRATCQAGRVSTGPSATNTGHGAAPDGSLFWTWAVNADGSRSFVASIKQGRRDRLVVDDRIAAPPPPTPHPQATP